MASTLVNIPRSELVEALRGAHAIQQVDSMAIAAVFEAAIGKPTTPTVGVDPDLMNVATNTLIELMADSLIIGDRSRPLVSREAILNAGQSMLLSVPFDEGTEAAVESNIDAFGSIVADFAEGLLNTPEKSHDQAWSQVNAYRLLKAKYDVIDPNDQKLRDEFIRLSSSEADWIEQTERVTKAIATSIRQMVDAIIGTLLEALAAQEELDDDDISELKSELAAELDGTFTEQLTNASRAVQAYSDQRFIEVWVTPDLDGA